MAQSNTGFLNELMQSLGKGVRRRRGADPAPVLPALERLSIACEALMGRRGEASLVTLADQALEAYAELDAPARGAFFATLLTDYGAPADGIRRAYAAWDAAPSDAALVTLFEAVEPRRQTLLRRLNLCPGGTSALLRMRAHLLDAMRRDAALAPLDADFSHLLASWFNRGFLVLRRIDWNTSAAVLEKIVAYEAVHQIRDWDDLRRRLDPADRRCYAFFHPATGDEPLIFVEVALCRGIPDAIGPLLAEGDGTPSGPPDTAVFYSISNCQPGLRGISFGNFLIKQVVRDLSIDLPELATFVTLSPAPGFARWLTDEAGRDPTCRAVLDALEVDDWRTDAAARDELAPRVRSCAARYLVHARDAEGAPLDPVSRFHLGNGASAHRVHWPADLSSKALERSHGVMVNYLYELDAIEARHEAFVRDGTIAYGSELRDALRRGVDPSRRKA